MKAIAIRFFLIVLAFGIYVSTCAAQEKVYTNPDKAPMYPGGKPGIAKFLKDNVVYPAEAAKDSTKGTVTVSFIIEKTGGLSSIEVAEGIGKGCDVEATRVVRKMGKWYPGSVEGKPVRTLYKLAIKFPQ